ncbi:hypothetical protein [Mesoflavibacter profundi]|uniref:EGF-like domain-containing protein n=1 Tax=Mesoflavibacter profundi TaxID=2708110 RepID=A0ABT4S1E6_9FLAO|nr:hypothetical protein [Mesoflavibacter profundi]MDA0177894.1 hypothetical protein [Mesoflavibacter profundi]
MNSKLTAPNGLSLSKSISNLNQKIFNDKVEIVDLNYLETPNNYEGFAVEITYINENGDTENIIFARNINNYKYNTDEISINSTFYGRVQDPGDIVVRCSGSGCCYSGGNFNTNTGEMTFYCKCEGNSEGNSSCTMTITTG